MQLCLQFAFFSSQVVLIADAIMESSSSTQSTEIQRLIVDIYRRLSVEERQTVFNQLLNEPGVQMLGLQESHNIRIYFHCSTLEALVTLRQLFDTGRLKEIVESFFGFLLAQAGTKGAQVKFLYLINYCQCNEDFSNGRNGILEAF